MEVAPIRRYSFDLADLAPPVRLRVVEGGVPLPSGAHVVAPTPRPRWLPRLLPIVTKHAALRCGISTSAAPTFAAILRDSLTALFASAGEDSNLATVAWEHGLAVGLAPLTALPAEPAVHLLPVDLAAVSAARLLEALRLLPEARCLVAVNGDVERLEARFLGDRLPAGIEVIRLPLLSERQLANGYGRECLPLARRLVARHREAVA